MFQVSFMVYMFPYNLYQNDLIHDSQNYKNHEM